MSLRYTLVNAHLCLRTKKYHFTTYKSICMSVLDNMQKILSSRVINLFPRVQNKHKKEMKNNKFKVFTADGAIHFALIICYMTFQDKE